MACADAEFDASIREVVDRCDLLSEVYRMMKVVVEDQWAQPDPFGYRCHSEQRREGRPAIADVIRRMDHIEPGGLGGDRVRTQLVGVARPDLVAETERRHAPMLRPDRPVPITQTWGVVRGLPSGVVRAPACSVRSVQCWLDCSVTDGCSRGSR